MIRIGEKSDLDAVGRIQRESPDAAQWDAGEYAFMVAEREGRVAGFAVWRGVGGGEWELLNIAVDPPFRRRGVARELLAALPAGRMFLEVRESNAEARALYESSGFTIIGRRRSYYKSPVEDGIVMELQKW